MRGWSMAERRLQANGEPILYATITRQDDGGLLCEVSRALADFLDLPGQVVSVVEIKQARKLSEEREHRAYSKSMADAGICLECQRKLVEDFYERYCKPRAE